MFIEMTLQQQQLQQDVRTYMVGIMTPELRQEMSNPEYFEGGGPVFREQLQRMGTDGWIGLSWPESRGGKNWDPIEQYIFTNEVIRAGFPYPFLTIDAVAPVLAEHASEALQGVVSGVRQGKVVIAIGYSEPDAGTDLGSLKTRAQRDGDDWVINGQKIWTSLANFADYIWLAARTDPDPNKKHKGLTMFLVPTSAEGFSQTPIWTLGVRTNATYYQDLRLPDKYRVGGVNGGWKLITGQLNRERLSLVTHGQILGLYQDVCEWAAATRGDDGRAIIEQSWVQGNLAKVKVGVEALKLICWKQAWAMANGSLGMAEASVAKVYGTEFFVEAYRLLLEVMGQAGTIVADSPGAILQGRIEHRYRCGSILTFGGGTNEVQRDIIAGAGLWLPRSR
jgi:alkylation response protein AidB-like acyl-CoA dehydrogenase